MKSKSKEIFQSVNVLQQNGGKYLEAKIYGGEEILEMRRKIPYEQLNLKKWIKEQSK